jgi:hypothetical protein
MDNEPSVGAPWLYLFAGQPHQTQEVVRQVLDGLWSATPYGLPGNDDLGAMSSWYVWAAMGMYPGIPGRAELLLAAPIFPRIVIRRADGTTITITAPQAGADGLYVRGLRVDGRATTRPWLPESFIAQGGQLEYDLSDAPDTSWGTEPDDVPPSFSPPPSAPPAHPVGTATVCLAHLEEDRDRTPGRHLGLSASAHPVVFTTLTQHEEQKALRLGGAMARSSSPAPCLLTRASCIFTQERLNLLLRT